MPSKKKNSDTQKLFEGTYYHLAILLFLFIYRKYIFNLLKQMSVVVLYNRVNVLCISWGN